MATIIAVTNQKGGVGKTTTVVNLGAALAEKGKHILLVDLDPQGSLSSAFGVDVHPGMSTTYTLFVNPALDPRHALMHVRERIDLIPADIHLAAVELELVDKPGREYVLKEILTPLRDDYDYILIDCGPNLGLLTVNALTAADEVIVPLVCEFLALRGLGTLFENIALVRRNLNRNLHVRGILPVMYDARSSHPRQILEETRALFGEFVFPVVVRRSIRFAEAAVLGAPILEYAPTHPGAQAYRQLAEVIINGQERDEREQENGQNTPQSPQESGSNPA